MEKNEGKGSFQGKGTIFTLVPPRVTSRAGLVSTFRHGSTERTEHSWFVRQRTAGKDTCDTPQGQENGRCSGMELGTAQCFEEPPLGREAAELPDHCQTQLPPQKQLAVLSRREAAPGGKSATEQLCGERGLGGKAPTCTFPSPTTISAV